MKYEIKDETDEFRIYKQVLFGGTFTLLELLEENRKRGYKLIALTDMYMDNCKAIFQRVQKNAKA